jgi:effector-binding domain-containing protein
MSESDGQWVFTETEAGTTKVSWAFKGENSFFRRFFGLLLDGMVGPQFESGLNSLKAVAEAKALAMPKLEVVESTREEMNYYGIRKEIPVSEMNSSVFSKGYAQIGKYLGEDTENMTGAPMGLFYTWDMETQKTDMAVALPVSSTKAGNDTVMPGTLAAGRVLMVNHYGPYDGTGKAHSLIEIYAKENGINIGAPAAEIYVTDPGTEPDTAKWLTQIVYPVLQ